MKTDSVFCSLSKKCKQEYTKEVSEKLSKDEENLEEVYKSEKDEIKE
ncbi:hypothetical protein [Romboutsia sp.]